MRAFGYLRVSTQEQDPERAREDLERFALDHGLPLVKCFVEQVSGAQLDRPELFNLIDVTMPGDVLLLEQIDRLTRLSKSDWQQLRSLLQQKQLRIVALDLPSSHRLIQCDDEFTLWMMEALNGMMLDMLAAIARKDYQDRRRRQQQGTERARAAGKHLGRPRNIALEAAILRLLQEGVAKKRIANELGCSRSHVYRLAERVGLHRRST
jgi:DNA invertase Pin-like site-specific DNA recombinase